MAVLVSKATCEIPPKFAGRAPVHPDVDRTGGWAGASGLAEDIRRYGKWMRDEAESRIGHLYPKSRVTESMAADRDDLRPYVGKDLTVIAWLWARTVASPDPMLRGTHVPLASSFVLSSKKGKQAIVGPTIDHASRTYRFVVKSSGIGPDEYARARKGTKAGRGPNFTCLVTGAPISGDHIKTEGKAGRMGARLMAVVAEGKRTRLYLDPTEEMEEVALSAESEWRPTEDLPDNPRWFSPPGYGMPTYGDLFTDRQLVALTTFSDLVAEARDKVLADALAAGMDPEAPRLADGGTGAEAYADAVATYLGLCVSRQANRCSNLNFWDPGGANVQQVFARQALPMVWDFCEANPFSDSSGNFVGQVGYLAKVVEAGASIPARVAVIQQDAAGDTSLLAKAMVATDPPYYDNIGYADLSDFFYVWLRRTLRAIWPDLSAACWCPRTRSLWQLPIATAAKTPPSSSSWRAWVRRCATCTGPVRMGFR